MDIPCPSSNIHIPYSEHISRRCMGMSHKHSDGFGFSLIVVLFILLIIVGVAYLGGYGY